MIYWCMNLNFIKLPLMTGFVLQAHLCYCNVTSCCGLTVTVFGEVKLKQTHHVPLLAAALLHPAQLRQRQLGGDAGGQRELVVSAGGSLQLQTCGDTDRARSESSRHGHAPRLSLSLAHLWCRSCRRPAPLPAQTSRSPPDTAPPETSCWPEPRTAAWPWCRPPARTDRPGSRGCSAGEQMRWNSTQFRDGCVINHASGFIRHNCLR